MSWQLACFVVLGVVLLGGFAWYERSRPPAQVVALVAALAALAIAGRVAFAAFPNVKPTTDIVIFSGYALGPAPGFAVGALAALVSNFWFGQGPWTPWQMAGWGLCGVLGAMLALGRRGAGRMTLAAACGFAGLAYGALLNFSLMATYGGDLSLARFTVLEGRALPFDLAHAAGNVILALIAGPAMVRMLVRFRERFEWRRAAGPQAPRHGTGLRARTGAVASMLLLLALAVPVPPGGVAAAAKDTGAAATTGSPSPRVERAAAWLLAEQNADGGFAASSGGRSAVEATAWAMLGLAAAGRNPFDASRGGRTPVAYLRSRLAEISGPGDLARTALALESAGADPRRFGGRNLVADLRGLRRSDGSWEGGPGTTAYAVLALRAAGSSGGLAASIRWLAACQNEDGGWGDREGAASTADGTGAVLLALAPGGAPSRAGLEYLGDVQGSDGGFPAGASGPLNSQSTAWAMQGIVAAGRSPASFRRGGTSAPAFLSGLQASDGHYRYSADSDKTPVSVTAQAMVAAAGRALPVEPPPRQSTPPASTSPASAVTPPSSPTVAGSPTGVPAPGGAAPAPVPGAGSAVNPSAAAPAPSAATPPVAGADPDGGAPRPATPPLPDAATDSPPEAPSDDAGLPAVTTIEPDSEADAQGAGTGHGPLGSILLGLLAGGLLCTAAWAGRLLWMHLRYGL